MLNPPIHNTHHAMRHPNHRCTHHVRAIRDIIQIIYNLYRYITTSNNIYITILNKIQLINLVRYSHILTCARAIYRRFSASKDITHQDIDVVFVSWWLSPWYCIVPFKVLFSRFAPFYFCFGIFIRFSIFKVLKRLKITSR